MLCHTGWPSSAACRRSGFMDWKTWFSTRQCWCPLLYRWLCHNNNCTWPKFFQKHIRCKHHLRPWPTQEQCQLFWQNWCSQHMALLQSEVANRVHQQFWRSLPFFIKNLFFWPAWWDTLEQGPQLAGNVNRHWRGSLFSSWCYACWSGRE